MSGCQKEGLKAQTSGGGSISAVYWPSKERKRMTLATVQNVAKPPPVYRRRKAIKGVNAT